LVTCYSQLNVFPSLLGGGGVIGGWEKFPSFTVFLF
jgi:hypothetical protein